MWISDFTIDLLNCTMTVSCTRDPDRDAAMCTVRFELVGNIRVDRYHDPESLALGDMPGISVESLGNARSQYRLDTGDAMVVFDAASNPALTITQDNTVTPAEIFIPSG